MVGPIQRRRMRRGSLIDIMKNKRSLFFEPCECALFFVHHDDDDDDDDSDPS